MDTRTGEIRAIEEIPAGLRERFVDIDQQDMTGKQQRERKVSLQDHTSKLGKKLTAERRKRGLTRRRYRTLRKQGKLR